MWQFIPLHIYSLLNLPLPMLTHGDILPIWVFYLTWVVFAVYGWGFFWLVTLIFLKEEETLGFLTTFFTDFLDTTHLVVFVGY